MRAELANLNHCAVQFLSRAAVNLSWYYYSSTTGSTSMGFTKPTTPATVFILSATDNTQNSSYV